MARPHALSSQQANTITRWLTTTGIIALLCFSISVLLIFLPGVTVIERLRWLGGGICAQIATHTFVLGETLLPLCARNTGIYLGYLVTLSGIFLAGNGRAQHIPPRPLTIGLICGVLLCAIDGTNSFLWDLGLPHLYQPHNTLRLASGLLAGPAVAALLHPQQNRLLWNEYNEHANLPSLSVLCWLLPILLFCELTTVSQSHFFLYPLALLSSSGLILAISNVNLILVVAVSRRDESFTHYHELLPFYALAILCAFGELTLLAYAKLWLAQVSGIHL
jgi:uncharacterized membrane protein